MNLTALTAFCCCWSCCEHGCEDKNKAGTCQMFLQPFQHLEKIRTKQVQNWNHPSIHSWRGSTKSALVLSHYHHYLTASSASSNHEVRVSCFTTNPTNRFSSSIKLWSSAIHGPGIHVYQYLLKSIFITRRHLPLGWDEKEGNANTCAGLLSWSSKQYCIELCHSF